MYFVFLYALRYIPQSKLKLKPCTLGHCRVIASPIAFKSLFDSTLHEFLSNEVLEDKLDLLKGDKCLHRLPERQILITESSATIRIPGEPKKVPTFENSQLQEYFTDLNDSNFS